MASHWACNMSPLGRAGAPALRAESAAPSARREHGVLDHRQTLPDLANSANSVRRSLEQGRARRQADPLTDPRRTRTRFFFHLGPRKSLRNRILTIFSPYVELILLIFSYLPLMHGLSSPILVYLAPSWPDLGPSWAQLASSWAQLGPSHEPPTLQKHCFSLCCSAFLLFGR